MRRYLYSLGITIFAVSFILISCEKKSDNNCNVSNPVEELDWLKSSIEEIEQDNNEINKYAYFVSATYNGDDVFYFGNCHPAINYASYLLNCNGDTLGNTNEFNDDLTNKEIIWKHAESECNFDD